MSQVHTQDLPCGSSQILSLRITGSSTLQGTTYVCVPGIGGSATAWDAFAREMCACDARATVIAFDLRCHGLSTCKLQAFDTDFFKTYALDIAHVINALGLKKVVLVGHSFGGLICLSYLSHLPARMVTSVYLFNTPSYTTLLSSVVHRPLYSILCLVSNDKNDGRRPYTPQLHQRYKNSWDFSPSRIYHDIRSVGLFRFIIFWLLILSTPVQDYGDLPDTIRYFCIWGKYDLLVSRKNALGLHAQLPRAQAYQLATNHNCIVNQAVQAAHYVVATQASLQAPHGS